MLSRAIGVTAVAVVALSVAGAPAHAHSQTVQPPAQNAPTVSGPISKLWAQAHCNSAAPAVHADHDVVVFTPAGALSCLDTWANPGGQVHPHAVSP